MHWNIDLGHCLVLSSEKSRTVSSHCHIEKPVNSENKQDNFQIPKGVGDTPLTLHIKINHRNCLIAVSQFSSSTRRLCLKTSRVTVWRQCPIFNLIYLYIVVSHLETLFPELLTRGAKQQIESQEEEIWSKVQLENIKDIKAFFF